MALANRRDHMRACVPACLRACVPAWVRGCVPACLRACVPACLRACAPARLRACAPARLRACAPACLRACVPAWVRGCVGVWVCGCVCTLLFVKLDSGVAHARKHECTSMRKYRGPRHQQPTACIEATVVDGVSSLSSWTTLRESI